MLLDGRVARCILGSRSITFVCIVDVYHVLEHLGKVVYHCCAQGVAEAKQFVTGQLDDILGV